jgi:hypothetical protein
MVPLRLVLQAYGREDIKAQALYAVWSALAWSDGVPLEVHVYTDDAAWLAPLGERVRPRLLTPEEIRAWRGPRDFVHRLKAEMIRDVVRRHPGGKLLYVDGDVSFRSSPAVVFDRIGPGRAVLHVREYDIASHPTKQLRRFRRRMRGVTFRGRPVELGHAMWNAGAVGLDGSHYALLDEWLAMIDEVYEQWPYWIHEQWALSQLLERAGAVSPADDVIFHYWAQKEEAVAAIGPQLELLRTLPFDEALARVRAAPLRLPPFVRRRTTLLQRLARILAKR